MIRILSKVHKAVLAVKGDSFKNRYADNGNTKYDNPKKINLVVQTDCVVSTK